jgi:hypothetical protein
MQNGLKVENNELKNGEGIVGSLIQAGCTPDMHMEGVKKLTEPLSQESRYPGWEPNRSHNSYPMSNLIRCIRNTVT